MRSSPFQSLPWSMALKIKFLWLPWQIGFHGNQCPKLDSVPVPDVPAKFGADRSVNGEGDE